jgi:hypothetical protein
MGAHGTLEEALANVASFATASQASKSSGSKHSSSKISKHKSHKKHKKSKDRSKDISKDKKASHKKHKKASSSSDESSDDAAQHIDLSTQLAKGREAARVTRRILTNYSDMRADLREVLVLTATYKTAHTAAKLCTSNYLRCCCSCSRESMEGQPLPLTRS